MTEHRREIWFPAKRFGWGWGFPIAWQGWVVLLGFIVLVFIGVDELRDTQDRRFFVYFVLITAGFIAICWWKGERPRWRWGRDD